MGLDEVDIDQSTPLLVTTDGPVGNMVTASMLRAMFHKAISIADLKDVGYTPHSLRRGGATFSYHAGVPLDQIQKHGTWRSDAVHRYLLDRPAFDAPVAHSFRKLLTDYDY